MIRNLAILMLLSVFVTGCISTTRSDNYNLTQVNQLQMRVVQLENRLDEKDEEIGRLEKELDDVNSFVKEMDLDLTYQEVELPDYKMKETESILPKAESSGDDEKIENIIRISASTREVQRALKNANFYNGKVDGKIGNLTKQAIIDFQKENELEADGIVGKQTWSILRTHLY